MYNKFFGTEKADTLTDFSRSSANGPDTDRIVVDGNYLGSSSSFFGTTLYFDYNNDAKSDGTVLLLSVSKSEWALDLQAGALVFTGRCRT